MESHAACEELDTHLLKIDIKGELVGETLLLLFICLFLLLLLLYCNYISFENISDWCYNLGKLKFSKAYDILFLWLSFIREKLEKLHFLNI